MEGGGAHAVPVYPQSQPAQGGRQGGIRLYQQEAQPQQSAALLRLTSRKSWRNMREIL